MSVSDLESGLESGLDGFAANAQQGASSPFAPPVLLAPPVAAEAIGDVTAGETLFTPFSESMATHDESALAAEAVEALLAEFEDEEFQEAIDAVVNEAAGRHLRSVGTWSRESEAPVLATSDTEQWLESLAAEADRVLGALEAHFGDRPVDSLRDGELDEVPGLADRAAGLASPVDAQEQFLGALLKKAKKVVAGVAKVAKKGLAVIGKFFPVGKLISILRRLVQPLLRQVLRKLIGRLPSSLRAPAMMVAQRFGAEAETTAAWPDSAGAAMAAELDRQLADAVLAPNEALAEQLVSAAEHDEPAGGLPEGPGPLHDLDRARARLARELAEATPGEPPTAQMEQFLPIITAAMPLVRMGVRIVGRKRVEGFLAAALATLAQGIIGKDPATLLSRHLAPILLQSLGLEAENSASTALSTSSLGMEALVEAVEDTVREVMSLPAESLENELLLEAAVQDLFASAAARHLPAPILRPEVVESASAGEHAVWVMMPRVTRPCFRYKKYSRVFPVLVHRSQARAIGMPDGDTLEARLLDAGVRSWPVTGEVELYELLPGAELGHIAAFEGADHDSIADGTRAFEELSETAAGGLLGNLGLAGAERPGAESPAGRRYYRLRVATGAMRRRPVFAARLDLSSPQPVLRLHLLIGERAAHTLASHLERRRMVPVVSLVRGLVGAAFERALSHRLQSMLTKRGVPLAPGAASRLAGHLSDAIVRTVSEQLPAAAATLSQAAKNPAPGLTLTFVFTFADKAALGTAVPGSPALTIRPGAHRD